MFDSTKWKKMGTMWGMLNSLSQPHPTELSAINGHVFRYDYSVGSYYSRASLEHLLCAQCDQVA